MYSSSVVHLSTFRAITNHLIAERALLGIGQSRRKESGRFLHGRDDLLDLSFLLE